MNKALRQAHALILAQGLDLQDVPVHFNWASVRSHCATNEDGNIWVSMGLGATALRACPHQLRRLLLHELGHAFWFQIRDQLTTAQRRRFRRLFGDERGYEQVHVFFDLWRGYDNDKYASYYASRHSLEDFAETFRVMCTGNYAPRTELAKKVRFITDMIKVYGA